MASLKGNKNNIPNDQSQIAQPVQGCNIYKLLPNYRVHYTDPRSKADSPNNKFSATFISYIGNGTDRSEIRYDPEQHESASTVDRARNFEVETKHLSCIPTATAMKIPDTGKTDGYVKGTIAINDGDNVPTIANDSNASNLKNAEVVFTRPKVYPVATVVEQDNQDELTDYLNLIDGNNNEFDINILRNEGNDGYKIQTITAKTQDNGKYNMVTLDLDIGSDTSDVDREVMKSQISIAIDIVLSNGATGNETAVNRDLTAIYNAANREMSIKFVNNLVGNYPLSKRGGGKLSRKRKRNMTKSKKRKVRTTRRRR